MSFEDQQGHGAGDAQRIHDGELPLRILFQKLFPGTVDGLDGAAQLTGEGDEEKVLFLQDGLKIIQVGGLVQGGGHRDGAVAHHIVISFVIQHLAQIIKILLAVQRVRHVDDGDIVLLFQVKGQVAVAVGHEDVVLFHGKPPSAIQGVNVYKFIL